MLIVRCLELLQHKIKIPTEMKQNLMILHSYILVKVGHVRVVLMNRTLDKRVAQAPWVGSLCMSPLKPSLHGVAFHVRVPAVDISFASGVFLRVLRFPPSLKSTQIGQSRATN